MEAYSITDAPCCLPRVLSDGRLAVRALLYSSNVHPSLRGGVLFYLYRNGTLLLMHALGLPEDDFYTCHIHALGDCCTGGGMAFRCAGLHYNPKSHGHLNHAEGLPVLFPSGSRALSFVYTGRFQPGQVLSQSVVLHTLSDDHHNQPTGAAGGRIACSIIPPVA